MSFTSQQIDEVWDWIHSENQCVTVRYVSLHFCVSRKTACMMLDNLMDQNNKRNKNHRYEMTRTVFEPSDAGNSGEDGKIS